MFEPFDGKNFFEILGVGTIIGFHSHPVEMDEVTYQELKSDKNLIWESEDECDLFGFTINHKESDEKFINVYFKEYTDEQKKYKEALLSNPR